MADRAEPRPGGRRPKVSVVIPCYNRAEYIGQAVDSVLDQTWPNVELVVVDDGSTDGSHAVLKAYGERIRLMTHPGHVNRGQSASINLGLQSTDGEYVAILDSDDFWALDKLEKQVAYLEAHPDVGLVYGNGWSVNERGEKRFRLYGRSHREESDPGRVLRDCYFLVPNNSLFRREVLDKAGLFDESLRSAQDHDMAVRIAEVTKLAYIPDDVFFYRRHANSISQRSTELRWRNGFIILEKARSRYPYPVEVIRARRAVLHFRMGQVLLRNRKWLAAARHFAAAFANDPARSLGVVAGRERVSAPSS